MKLVDKDGVEYEVLAMTIIRGDGEKFNLPLPKPFRPTVVLSNGFDIMTAIPLGQ